MRNWCGLSNAIEPVSRTLLVELETDNAKGELFPGGYTDVHFKLPNNGHAVKIAANALLFQADGPRVATATPDGKVQLHAVTLGRDFGTDVEITTGIQAGDAVVLNPPALLANGAHVHVRPTPAAKADGPGTQPVMRSPRQRSRSHESQNPSLARDLRGTCCFHAGRL